MAGTIEAEYRRRYAAAQVEYAHAHGEGNRYRAAMGAVIVLAVLLLVHLLRGGGVAWIWILAVVVASGVGLTVTLLRARGRERRAWRVSALYERGLERVRGEAPGSGFTGEAFAEPGHLYENDLNVLGKDSLFDLLATTRTTVGQRGLARLLLEPVEADEARRRQEAVRELAGMTDLRERVALLGRFKFEDVPAWSFDSWLDAERSDFAVWNRWVLVAATAAWIGVAVVGLLLRVDWHLLRSNLELLFLLQGVLCLRVQKRARTELEAARRLFGQTEILREGLRVLRAQTFASERLVALQREAEGEDQALARLERTLSIVEQRVKEWFYPLSLAVCGGTQAALALDAWKREFDHRMRRWLAAWAEFEALLSLATYAAEHEENVYPEIADTPATAVFEAEGLWHPLLSQAVANDVKLGAARQFLLISGSNMSGKSTLLRAMGANAVLAQAGAPVAARSMRLCAVRIGASIAINDSPAEGKSKFLAEVERLRGLVTLARENPGRTLFLIDELFSGTNSADRRAAAESVLRSLVQAGSVGAISTHDLTLAEIAELPEMHGENVHMASPQEDDPLGFDYLLKAGVNQTTNAMAIVRMLGLG